jgi:hypothetical protein
MWSSRRAILAVFDRCSSLRRAKAVEYHSILDSPGAVWHLAVGEGFEPPVTLRLRTLSRRMRSTALPPHPIVFIVVFVPLAGIEPTSSVSETNVLSVELQRLFGDAQSKHRDGVILSRKVGTIHHIWSNRHLEKNIQREEWFIKSSQRAVGSGQ